MMKKFIIFVVALVMGAIIGLICALILSAILSVFTDMSFSELFGVLGLVGFFLGIGGGALWLVGKGREEGEVITSDDIDDMD